MQSDSARQADPAPLPDPASPSFQSLHRHQPTQTAEPYRDTSPSGSIRRRPLTSRDPDAIYIDIKTPFDDALQRRKEGYPVSRTASVREVKDGIAVGQYGGSPGVWVRPGMRLVWQGRIIRDEETVSDVVANSRDNEQVHTFHLVARRVGGTPALPRNQSGYFAQHGGTETPVSPAPEVIPPTAVARPAQSTSHEGQALLDSIHYLLFTARHHLFHLLGRRPLGWYETVPPPLVEQATAREAIMSVIRTVIDARTEEERSDWLHWEGAFDDVNQHGEVDVESVEQEVRSLWRGRVGREWSDKGQSVEVEIDQTIFQLHLPPLSRMEVGQLQHLRIYLNITSLLPMLYPFLPQLTAEDAAPPRPTPTVHPSGPAPQHQHQRVSLPPLASVLPRIPLVVLQHMFFSALKLVGMLWMLTQGMPWSDTRLWIIGGAATGWWVADGWQQYMRHRPRPRIPVPQPPPDAAAAQLAAEQAAPGPNPNVAPPVAAAIHRPTSAASRSAPHLAIPLIHLSADASQLRLVTDTLNAARQAELARTPAQPQRRPSRLVTQLLLPIALWFITLIPEFEAIRARAIRRRERSMRVIVGELNASAGTSTGEEENPAETSQQAQDPARLNTVLPEGLNEVARQYYLRVMERGEGIDWEEEREAQRAMGMADDDEGGAGGFIGIF